jgi:hypothetical protein
VLNCRANEIDKRGLFKRYVSFVQDLYSSVPKLSSLLLKLAETHTDVNFSKGFLKLRPGTTCIFVPGVLIMRIVDSLLTDNEETTLRNHVVRVSGAGVKAVDGDYIFSSIVLGSGLFRRSGIFNDKPVVFCLYKCSVGSVGQQWYISIPPDGAEPGTTQDLDFYCASFAVDMNGSALFPPATWQVVHNQISRGPAPRVSLVEKEKPAVDDAPRVKVVLPPPPSAISATVISPARRRSKDMTGAGGISNGYVDVGNELKRSSELRSGQPDNLIDDSDVNIGFESDDTEVFNSSDNFV